jgi:hypothetical protein
MGISVGTVSCHDIVKGHSTGLETAGGFCVVDSADETHAFGHGVAMVPRWTEGIFLYKPTGREDND